MKTILTIGNQKVVLADGIKTAELTALVETLKSAKMVARQSNYDDRMTGKTEGLEIEQVSDEVVCEYAPKIGFDLLSDKEVVTQEQFYAQCEAAKKNAKRIKHEVLPG